MQDAAGWQTCCLPLRLGVQEIAGVQSPRACLSTRPHFDDRMQEGAEDFGNKQGTGNYLACSL